MGGWSVRAKELCSSRPLVSGRDTARTRQLGPLGLASWRYSAADAKAVQSIFLDANRSASASRTRKSLSTTKTMSDSRLIPSLHNVGKVNAKIVPRGALSLGHSW